MKLVPIPKFIVKTIENNTMYSVQELHLWLFSSSAEFILASFTSSSFSRHSSTNLSTNFFLHVQFHSLNTHQYHMIYHIHTHNYSDSK